MHFKYKSIIDKKILQMDIKYLYLLQVIVTDVGGGVYIDFK